MTNRNQSYSTADYVACPPGRLSLTAIREANEAGKAHAATGVCWSYRTPVLQRAYDMGLSGEDLSSAPVVRGLRFGQAPESGVSTNYRSGRGERGLSLAQESGHAEIGAAVWFAGRQAYEYEGVKVGTGTDGETLILPLHVENLDL